MNDKEPTVDAITVRDMSHDFDERGERYSMPQEAVEFMREIDEMHYVSIVPNAIRGNHFHELSKELIILNYSDDWQLSWRLPDDDRLYTRQFSGKGMILVEIQAKVTHAFKNTGNSPIYLFCFSTVRSNTIRNIILT